MRRECRERFPRLRLQRKLLVSMPHGTCATPVMHVGIANPWWRGKRSRHSWRMRNPQFYVSGKRPIRCHIVNPFEIFCRHGRTGKKTSDKRMHTTLLNTNTFKHISAHEILKVNAPNYCSIGVNKAFIASSHGRTFFLVFARLKSHVLFWWPLAFTAMYLLSEICLLCWMMCCLLLEIKLISLIWVRFYFKPSICPIYPYIHVCWFRCPYTYM